MTQRCFPGAFLLAEVVDRGQEQGIITNICPMADGLEMKAMDATQNLTLIDPDSFAKTLEQIQQALFYDTPLLDEQRYEAARWLADRQGLRGSYIGMFAPTAYDLVFDLQTFTGEVLRSGVSVAHVLSEEALAALFRLAPDLPEVHPSIERARRAIFARLEESQPQGQWSGYYCCGMCSAALWRHLASSGRIEDYRRLEHGLQCLQTQRDGAGRWKRFPYYYTLLALSEMDLPSVREEAQYAMPGIEKLLKHAMRVLDQREETELERRRRMIMGRILEKV